MASSSRGIQIGSAWFQRKINLRPQHRGVHLVTEEILKQIPEISQFTVGLCHIQSKDINFNFWLINYYHSVIKCYFNDTNHNRWSFLSIWVRYIKQFCNLLYFFNIFHTYIYKIMVSVKVKYLNISFIHN